MRKILIVTDKAELITAITQSIGGSYRIDQVPESNQAQVHLKKTLYEIVFVDLDMLSPLEQTCDHLEAINPFVEMRPRAETVVITPVNRIRQAVQMVKAGITDYIISPVETEEVKHVMSSIFEQRLRRQELVYLREKFWKPEALKFVITRNPQMAQVYNKIRAVASTKSTVLLSGETGTGKNLIARLIHQHSSRINSPFISVHCGAIPDTLIESELFGHEKGAFTGAVKRRIGKFEMAKGGTIFLDEIGTITPAVQIKLLQVLQDGTFSRVGGEELLSADVRIVTATNSNIKMMTDEGRFRKDLYYRLNIFPIEIPPLRERTEDILNLTEVLINKYNQVFNKRIGHIHPHVLNALKAYPWPGNIRELENILERAFILETTDTLCPESFPLDLITGDISMAPDPSVPVKPLTNERQKALEEFERRYLKDLLTRNKGRINKSAEDAGISTRQLYKLMSKYGIQKETFREQN